MEDRENHQSNLIRIRRIISQLNGLLLICLDLAEDQLYRNQIQEIMDKILETRKLAVTEIGLIKTALDLPIHCPDREHSELTRLKTLAQEAEMKISATEIESYFSKLFAKSRAAQAQQAIQNLEGEPRLMK